MEEILETLESLTPTSKIHYCKSRDFNILKTNTEETGKSVIFKKSYFRTELQKEKQMNFEIFLIPFPFIPFFFASLSKEKCLLCLQIRLISRPITFVIGNFKMAATPTNFQGYQALKNNFEKILL